jgi:hypothetical protein
MSDRAPHHHRRRLGSRHEKEKEEEEEEEDRDAGREKARRLLLDEQGIAFKRGGAALEAARAGGIGFLYDEDEGQLREREKEMAETRVREGGAFEERQGWSKNWSIGRSFG